MGFDPDDDPKDKPKDGTKEKDDPSQQDPTGDTLIGPTADTVTSKAVPSDTDGTPYCPRHFCRMKQYSGPKKDQPGAHYRCRVQGCKETGKRVSQRVERAVPVEPTYCQRCRCKKPCQVDDEASDATKVILVCVDCGSRLLPKPTPALLEARLNQTGKL